MDLDAFSEAYAAHRPRAFSSAMRVLGDHAAAEDVVQDVFLTLWRDPGLYDPARGSLAGYIAMMARSRAVDRARSLTAARGAVERLGVRDEARPGTEEGPADVAARREDRGRVLEAVAKLPALQREAILLAFGKGLSAAEIAAASDVPLGTAKSRLRLGLQKTREALAA
ncbi:MAG: sigma-70 family RNA polymerase sigma factor [Thermoleophilaceae bacterium]|nr:sigma-70 family RNA polymerase sigma factor [Thermoleophilaceae bacterium]